MDRLFNQFAATFSHWCASGHAFVLALLLVLAWALSGPAFGFSDTWQLLINTSTTVVTFLIVFLIQNAQRRDSNAIQAKLDELIRSGNAQNRYIGIENVTDEELEQLRRRCRDRASGARNEAA